MDATLKADEGAATFSRGDIQRRLAERGISVAVY